MTDRPLSEEKKTNGTFAMLEEAARTAVFPLTFYFENGGQGHTNGITKRELFAAIALQGCLAANCFNSPEQNADYATRCADALLKELAK